MAKRARLQIDLAPRQQHFLRRLGEGMATGNDAETTRRVLEVFENLADSVDHGYKIAVVPADDEAHPDALPELTRAIRGDHFEFLIQRPHAWRRQPAFKGRRLTVGQFLHQMNVNGWTPEQAAREFDLPDQAAYEAIAYGDRHRALIEMEAAEDARTAREIAAAAPAR